MARGPLNLVALLLALGLAMLCARAWQARAGAREVGLTALAPPGDLPPARVGALVTGRVGDDQIVATILDLARRGALAIEPSGAGKAQVRLLDHDVVGAGYEDSVWQSLVASVGEDGVVAPRKLPDVRLRWGRGRKLLREELETHGWFDPQAGARRRPLYLAGTVALLLSAAAFAVTGVGQELWGIPGSILLFAGSIAAFVVGYAQPATTAQGEAVAAPWRGYRAGLKLAGRNSALGLNLDEAMPYAVAMGVVSTLNKRLKAASAQGYAPLWLGRGVTAGRWEGGFYPCWAAFHAGTTPSSSGGSASGAAAGGGGAGGSF
jgi:hypothetical protein